MKIFIFLILLILIPGLLYYFFIYECEQEEGTFDFSTIRCVINKNIIEDDNTTQPPVTQPPITQPPITTPPITNPPITTPPN
jgi:hypothetical protein